MWSVVISSPTLRIAFAVMSSPKGSLVGNGLMFGPYITSTFFASSGVAGIAIILSLITNSSGKVILGNSPSSLGSVR